MKGHEEEATLVIHVSGMKCNKCANKVRGVLLPDQQQAHITHQSQEQQLAANGEEQSMEEMVTVTHVDVDVGKGLVTLQCKKETGVSWSDVQRIAQQKISDLNFQVHNVETSHSSNGITLSVLGMKCGNCQRKVTGLLRELQFVDHDSVNVDFQAKKATFRVTSPSNVKSVRNKAIEAIKAANFTVYYESGDQEDGDIGNDKEAKDKDWMTDLIDALPMDTQVTVFDQQTPIAELQTQSTISSPPAQDVFKDIAVSKEMMVDEPGVVEREESIAINIPQLSGLTTGFFTVTGMTCSSCVSKVEETANAIEGVMSASVNLLTGTMKVQYRSNSALQPSLIAKHVSDIGYECALVSEKTENDGEDGESQESATLRVDIEGMTCASCVSNIENNLLRISGVDSAVVNLVTKTGTIVFNSNLTGARSIIDKINSIGFSATVAKEEEAMASDAERAGNREISLWKRRLIVSSVLGIPLFIIAMADMLFSSHSKENVRPVDWLICVLSMPVYMYSGWHFHSRSYKALRNGYADMNVLISISTTAAFYYSVFVMFGNLLFSIAITEFFFETAALVILFQNLGKYLESIAKKRTSHSLIELLRLQPSSALLLTPIEHQGEDDADADAPVDKYEERKIDIGLLQRGDLVKVLPGEKVPTDGVVESGTSSVDESMITGESRSVLKEIGSTVIGSTINEDGALIVRATRVGKDTMLSQIMRLVQEAQNSKPSIQRFDDAISRVFVPFIVLLSVMVFLWWMFLSILGIAPLHWIPNGYNSFLFSLLFSMAILVIACPCALGLATPTAIMVGSGVGAKHGILFKSGEAFETLTQVDYIVFDKTGTLTKGKPSVVHAEGLRDADDLSIDMTRSSNTDMLTMWNYIGTAESGSEHPLGKALFNYAKEMCDQNGVSLISSHMQLGDLVFTTVPGHGIRCLVPVRKPHADRELNIFVGKQSFVEESTGMKIPSTSPTLQTLNTEENHGRTVIWCGVNEKVLGFVSLFDVIKEDARTVIHMLKDMKIGMCIASGDRQMAVHKVAQKLGISHALSECLPDQKLDEIKRLQHKGLTVAVVGDGINDSPSLAKADVGIAIGAGAEVAIQSADIVLVKGDLGSLITSIDLARKVYNRIRLNHVWALGYNVLLVPLAAGVLYPLFKIQVPPMLAALCMVMSSLLVLGSSLLLNTYRTPFRKHESRQRKEQKRQRRRALRDIL